MLVFLSNAITQELAAHLSGEAQEDSDHTVVVTDAYRPKLTQSDKCCNVLSPLWLPLIALAQLSLAAWLSCDHDFCPALQVLKALHACPPMSKVENLSWIVNLEQPHGTAILIFLCVMNVLKFLKISLYVCIRTCVHYEIRSPIQNLH